MTLDEKERLLRGMDEFAFLNLGAEQVAYVRQIEFLGTPHYAVHTGDGTPVTIASTHDLAVTALHQTDLELVTVH